MSTRRFIVSGRVQGVGFRWFVVQRARRLGLTGFARNCANGTVEVVASGDETSLAALQQSLNKGPDFADVRGVESFDVPDHPPLADFDIRRS